MHNVVQNYRIEDHDVEITQRSSLVAFGGSRGIHSSSEFYEFELRIDDEVIKPPQAPVEGIIVNWRSTGFDDSEKALTWAKHLLQNPTKNIHLVTV